MDKFFSPIKERIIYYIEYKKISKESFLKKTGISASNFKGKGAISELGGDKIVNILSIYPEINPAWLIKGEEPMLVPKKTMGALDFVFQQAKYWGEMDRAINKLAAPGCEACKIKDMMLANQQQTIQSQEKIIHTLERDLHICKQSISKKQ